MTYRKGLGSAVLSSVEGTGDEVRPRLVRNEIRANQLRSDNAVFQHYA